MSPPSLVQPTGYANGALSTGKERATPAARSFVVVGQTLMFLHTCPDGVVLPFAAYPDGTVKVYTDVNHARESFYTDAQAPPAPGVSGTEGSA
jgi:hypothetical protein